MTRRRLNSIRLDKIAGVDKPCQQHATVAIVKRAPDLSALSPHYPLVKATFSEALNGAMVAERVNHAFWDSFDGLWQRNEAFREALTDELADGGDGSQASADYIASVDALVEEAVTAARNAGASATDDQIEKAITDAVTSWVETTKSQPKEQTMKISTKAQLTKAVAEFNASTSPYAHVGIIQKAAKDLGAEDELPAEGPLAVQKEEDPKLAKALREIAILKMSPDVRKHFDGLAEKDQDAFLAKSEADQVAEVEAANATDPVVYKCKDGTEIRKSDGAAAAMMAKRIDEQAAEIAELRGNSEGDAIEKRARTDFPNVALPEAVEMLKAAARVGEDKDAGKSILKTLSAMNKARDGLFTTLGSTEAPEGEASLKKAEADFNTAAAAIAKRDEIGIADAMSKARVEHPDLFKAAYPEREEEDA